MHRYCFMQCVFYMVSNTIYLHFSRLKFKEHNDEFIGHYPIRNGKGGEIGGAYDEFYKVPSTFLFLMY